MGQLTGTALANTVGGIRPPANPMQQDNPLIRNLLAMGAALEPPPVQSNEEVMRNMGAGFWPGTKAPNPFGTPSSAAQAIAAPFQRMGSGDIAGGLGELQAFGLQQYLLGRAGKALGGARPVRTEFPAEYQNAPRTLDSSGSAGANYTAEQLKAFKAKHGIDQPSARIQGEDFIEEARRRGMSRPTSEPIQRNMVPQRKRF